MSVEYLGKVSANLTSNQLGALVGLSIATNVDITWLKFNVDGIELLVSDKHLGVNMTWNSINDAGCVYGKEILIDGKRYKCRLLTGSNLNPASEDMSEWKTLMVDFYSQTNMIVNTVYTICQDDYYNSASNCVLRGGNSIESSSNIAKSTYSNNYGWRPVLERTSSFTINGVSENIGEITTFNQFNYTVSSLDKGEFNLIEKVDGVVIRTFNNQLDGEFTFNIEGFDSLSYGNHSIEIIIHDISAGISVSATSKFNKIKHPVQPIPTNSNLKQVMLHNKELEKEISYQNFRLSEKLKEKGIEVAENESLSSLIGKVEIGKKWASGVFNGTELEVSRFENADCWHLKITGLNFTPRLIFIASNAFTLDGVHNTVIHCNKDDALWVAYKDSARNYKLMRKDPLYANSEFYDDGFKIYIYHFNNSGYKNNIKDTTWYAFE